MNSANLSIRIKSSNGEVEIAGSEEAVDRWFKKVRKYLKDFKTDGNAASSGATPETGTELDDDTASPLGLNSSMVFGEYLIEFPSDISDTDRMLIAGQFIQLGDSEKSFTTRQAADALKDQGIKLTNPSECVRRNEAAKRVFRNGGRKFRVSASGAEYLRQLQSKQAVAQG